MNGFEDEDEFAARLRAVEAHAQRLKRSPKCTDEEQQLIDKEVAALKVRLTENHAKLVKLRVQLEILAAFTPANAPDGRERCKELSGNATESAEIIRRALNMRPAERIRETARIAQGIAAKDPPHDLRAFCEWCTTVLPDFETPQRIATAQFYLLYAAVQWARTGFNQFCPSEGLSVGLALTDASGAAPPKLPFDCLVITPPPGIVPFPWGDTVRWAESIMISRDVTDDAESIRIACGRGGQWIWRTLSGQDWSRGADPATVDEVQEAAWLAPEDRNALDTAERFARNLFLWLEATDEAKKGPTPVPRRLRESRVASGEVWPQQWEFGREVKITPELRHAAHEAAIGRTKRAAEGWRVRSRFVVRGHWRQQACGVGHSERRLKWIAAHWKGPEGAKAWAHLYTTAEGKTS